MPKGKGSGGGGGAGGANLQSIILGAITIVLALIGLGIAMDTIAPYLTGGASALNWTRYPGGEPMLKLFPLIMLVGLVIFGGVMVWMGTKGKSLTIKDTVVTVIVVVVAVISRIVPLGGNSKMCSGLIQGKLNWLRQHANPELSGLVWPKCAETIDPLPLWGNEIVRYSGESRRNDCMLPIVMDAADTAYDNTNASSFTGLTQFLGLVPLIYTVALMFISGLLGKRVLGGV